MNGKRSLLATLVVGAALLAVPATASAGVYCVGPGTDCAYSEVPPFSQDAAGITAAITAAAAHPGFDVLYIAAGTYPIDSNTFPALSASSDDLWIDGAGAGQTIFTGTAGASGPLVTLQLPSANSALNGVTLDVSFTSNYAYGISVKRGQFNDFVIDQTGNVGSGAPASAIELRAGTRAYHGTVSTDANVTGLSLTDGQTYAEKISFDGTGDGSGVYVDGTADTTLSSLRLVGYRTGLRVGGGTVDVSDSLVDMQASDTAIGVYVEDQDAGVFKHIQVHAARLTVIGSGASTGVYVNTQEAGDFSTGYYKDLLIYGTNPGFSSWLCNGFSGSTVQFDDSGLASNVAPSFGPNCDVSHPDAAPLILSGSPFVDFADRKLRPKWNSPVVDAGVSDAPWANDLDDGSRAVDGDNDGTITNDIGAFEYQADPPSGGISAPSSAAVGQSIAFSHSMTDPDPTNSVTGVHWSFGDGSTSSEDAPSHAFAAAGSYTVTVSATNQAGSVGTATAQVVVTAPAAPPPAPPTTRIVSKPKDKFKIGKAGFAVAKAGAPSFSAAFTGSAQAKFTLQSIGKKRKLKAVAGSQLFNLPIASLPVKFSFGGKWNRKSLPAGSYRVTITPVSPAGVAGKPETVDIKLTM